MRFMAATNFNTITLKTYIEKTIIVNSEKKRVKFNKVYCPKCKEKMKYYSGEIVEQEKRMLFDALICLCGHQEVLKFEKLNRSPIHKSMIHKNIWKPFLLE